MDENEKNAQRLTELESSMMHLQNDYDSLNEVVLENARRLEQVLKTIQGLTDRLKVISEPQSERSAEDEVPPHY